MQGKLSSRQHQLAWLLLFVGTLLCASCRQDTPEQALRQQVQALQAAAEARQPGEVLEWVAADFSGNAGMNRDALHNLLRMHLLGNAKVGVAIGPLQVQMQGEYARIRFTAVLSGGRGHLLPDAAQAFDVTTAWRVENGDWRVYYAQWQPVP